MKPYAIIIGMTFLTLSCRQQEKSSQYLPFSIDKEIPAKLKKAETASDFKDLDIDQCFWFFTDSLDNEIPVPPADFRKFYDTLSSYGDGVCDCMIKNDTVTLQGGIAYEGGIGFDVRITKKDFNGNIWVAGDGYKTDTSSKFQEEIILKSVYQTLKLSDPKSIAPGKSLQGELLMESEHFTSKDDLRPNKFYMKLLFNCKLDDTIVF